MERLRLHPRLRQLWVTFLYICAYLAVAITLINLQPSETVNPNPWAHYVEQLAFAITAGLIARMLLFKRGVVHND